MEWQESGTTEFTQGLRGRTYFNRICFSNLLSSFKDLVRPHCKITLMNILLEVRLAARRPNSMSNLFLSGNSIPARIRTVLLNKRWTFSPSYGHCRFTHNAQKKNPIQKFGSSVKSLYDPQGFPNQCCGSALVFQIQHFRPMRVRIQGFDD